MLKLRYWRRWVYRRVIKLEGSPHSVAFGMAIGVVFGTLMPPSLQLVIAIPVALLFRANVVAAFAGTCVSNPFTYVPYYYFTCRVGEAFLHFCGSPVALGANFKHLVVSLTELKFSGLGENLGAIVLCWVAGGLIVGFAASVPAYYLTWLFVIEIRKLRDFARSRRAARHEALAQTPAPPATPPEPDEEAPDEQPPPPAD